MTPLDLRQLWLFFFFGRWVVRSREEGRERGREGGRERGREGELRIRFQNHFKTINVDQFCKMSTEKDVIIQLK